MIRHIEETLEVGGAAFRFPLLCKRETLGAVALDHWWIDARTLYGQRGRDETTLRAVTDYFWALCRHHGTADEQAVQEVYILARLLPLTRVNAARRVFNDARVFAPRGPRAGDKPRDADDLGRVLRQGACGRMTFLEFKEKTAEVLGPPVLGLDVIGRYKALTAEIFGEARPALTGDGDGLKVAATRWAKAVRAWGRHRGFALEKRVLDVLSYEARAALHQCYSALWFELLPRLVDCHGLDALGRDFHELGDPIAMEKKPTIFIGTYIQ